MEEEEEEEEEEERGAKGEERTGREATEVEDLVRVDPRVTSDPS